MRDLSAAAAAALRGPHVATSRVSAWLDGQVLAEDVPVTASALWSADASLAVPERLTVTVPAVPPWLPTSPPLSPLACYGQRLRPARGVTVGGVAELVDLGWLRIQAWDVAEDGATVDVEALGLLAVLADARLTSTVQTAGTYAAQLRQLVDGLLPVDTSAMTDKAVPGKAWIEDRLDAVLELAATWGGRVVVDDTGTLVVLPAYADTDPTVAAYTDGDGGTVVSAPLTGARDGLHNAVITSGDTSSGDAAPVTGAAYDVDPASPTRWDGPYGRYPMFHSSPLYGTTAQANAAAASILARLLRRRGRRTVTAVPDPRLELGDVVTVTTGAGTADELIVRGRVDTIELPLLGDGGPMTFTVGELP